MAKIERTITINAPVEKVFEYLAQPTNLPEIWPSLVEVKDVKQTPQHVGDTFNWIYKMAGMRFEGSTQTTEYVSNERIVTKNTSGIPSTFVYTFEAEDGHTRFHEEIEYTIPIPLLGKLAEAFILRQNEHEADVFLANLKARMEA
jgi:uncharacterized membrane protein